MAKQKSTPPKTNSAGPPKHKKNRPDRDRRVRQADRMTEIKEPGNMIDAELSHDECWHMARLEFSCAAETEYFDLPRGRIVWDTLHRSGLLYHGNSTPLVVFEKLARYFRLPRWEARLDEHYLTGEALEAFYGLE